MITTTPDGKQTTVRIEVHNRGIAVYVGEEPARIFPRLKGGIQVVQIIMSPTRRQSDFELYYCDDPNPPPVPLPSDLMDKRMIRCLLDRMQRLSDEVIPELEQQLAESRASRTLERSEELQAMLLLAQKERRDIHNQLDEDTANGKSRKFKDESDTIRNTPLKNIKRFIAVLGADLPDVAERLWQSLVHVRRTWYFVPDADTTWIVEYRL